MYVKVNAGQAHERVSRRMTASVEAHWQQRAKKTSRLGRGKSGHATFPPYCLSFRRRKEKYDLSAGANHKPNEAYEAASSWYN